MSLQSLLIKTFYASWNGQPLYIAAKPALVESAVNVDDEAMDNDVSLSTRWVFLNQSLILKRFPSSWLQSNWKDTL